MENILFSIDKNTRELSSSGTRMYRIISGLIGLIIGLIGITRPGVSFFSSGKVYAGLFILTGLILIVHGLSGKEPFKVRYQLKMNHDSLIIKIRFYREIVIDLNSITQLKFLPFKLEISFKDYMKTYDFFWLMTSEFENFKIRISDYCLQKNIETEK